MMLPVSAPGAIKRTLRSRSNTSYDPRLNDLVKRIVTSNGRLMTETEIYRIKDDLRELPAARAINLLFSTLFAPNAATKKAPIELFDNLLQNPRIPFPLKKQLFNEIPFDLRSTDLYHSYMFAADSNDRFEEIKKTFEEMRSRKMASFKTYALFIRSNGRNGLMHEAERAFGEAVSQGCADARVYASYIRSLAKGTPLEKIQSLFDQASKIFEMDVLVCNAFINKAGMLGHFEAAEKVFMQLRERWMADRASYTTFIKISFLNNRYDLAKKAFEEAVEYGYYDKKTLNCYIDVSGKRENYDEALKAYKLSQTRDMSDHITYISFIFAACHTNHFEEASQAFNKGMEKYSDCEDLYTSYIKAMNESGCFEETERAYRLAIKRKEFHTSIFEHFIYGAGKCKKEAEAKEAFDLAENLQMLDAYVCSRYIDASALCGNFSEAKRGFDKLVEIDRVDAIAISRYLVACRKFSEYGEADRSYEISKSLGIVDSSIGSTMIDIQNDRSDLNSALRVYDEIKQLNKLDERAYNSYLKALTQNFDVNGAIKQMDEMIRLNAENEFSYVLIINMFGMNGNYQDAERYFMLAKSRKHTELNVYTAFINICAHNAKFEEAKSAFIEAKHLGYTNNLKLMNVFLNICGTDEESIDAVYKDIISRFEHNIYTATTYIRSMSKYGSLQKARSAFEAALKAGLKDSALYTAFMDALRIHNKLEEAMALFKKTREMGLADSRAYNCYINCNPPDLDDIAKEAIDSDIADFAVYSSLMSIHRNNFNEVQSLFELARAKNKVSASCYGTYISATIKANRFSEAMKAYKEAVENKMYDPSLFNSFMQASKVAGREDLVYSTYETAKSLGLADPFTYSIIIKTKMDAKGTFKDVMAILEECIKANTLDTVVYINCIKAAANECKLLEVKKLFEEAKSRNFINEELYCVYISSLSFIARKLKVKVIDKTSELSFETIKEVFLEAKAAGYYSEDLLVQYINSAAKYGRFDEAEEGLLVLFQKGIKTDVIRQAVQNWKIIHALLPETNRVEPANANQKLFSSVYPIWTRFKRRRKNDIINESIRLPETPPRLLEKVDKSIAIVDKDGKNPVHIILKEIFVSLAQKANANRLNMDEGYLGGGAVGYCMPLSAFEEAFEACAGSEEAPFLGDEDKTAIANIYEDRYCLPPNDWDFKFTISTKKAGDVESFPVNLDMELCAKTGLKPAEAKSHYSHKTVFINKDGNTFALKRFVDSSGEAYEMVWASKLARTNLFYSDAPYIPLGKITRKNAKKSVEVKSDQGSLKESLVFNLLKRLKAYEPDTINEFGFASYLSKIATGYLGDDEKLELHAIKTFVQLNDPMPFLENARDNHLQKSTDGALALLFNLCSMMIKYGYVLEVETLISKVKPLFRKPAQDPFFQALHELWILKGVPFMEVKAALEAIALLTLSNQTKIDEHIGEQILQFTHQKYSFLLPITPLNTLTALRSSNRIEDVKKIIQMFEPSLDRATATALGFTNLMFSDLNLLAGREVTQEAPPPNVLPVEVIPPALPSTPQKPGWIKSCYLWTKSWFY